MNAARLIPKDIRKFHREFGKADKERKKAGETAAKVEGHRLKKLLAEEIRAGAPGGRKFSPLSIIALRTSRGMKRTPLRKMAIGLRYQVKRVSGYTIVSFGYPENSSASWRRLAKQHQEGMTRPVSAAQRRFFQIVGHTISNRSKKINRFSRFLMLKKETTSLKTPSRPIIEPFWQAHKYEAGVNILINFQRKMRGERI